MMNLSSIITRKMLYSSIRFTFTLTLLQLLLFLASTLYLICMIGLFMKYINSFLLSTQPKATTTLRNDTRRSQLRAWITPLTLILCLLRFSTVFCVSILQTKTPRHIYIEYILLDIPNILVATIYALLVVVYIETFLQSRLHTDHISPERWTLYVLLFPLALIIRQIICYIMGADAISKNTIFNDGIQPIDHYRNVLYAIEIGDASFGLAMHLFFYLFLNIFFAGYPVRSTDSSYSYRITKVTLIIWSVSRWTWLTSLVLVYRFRIDILTDSIQPIIHPILLFLALVTCEIWPIIFMTCTSIENRSNDVPSVPSQIDLSEEDLFWPLDDSVLSTDPRGLQTSQSIESGDQHPLKWIDYIIRNSEAALMEDETTPTSEGRPLLLL